MTRGLRNSIANTLLPYDCRCHTFAQTIRATGISSAGNFVASATPQTRPSTVLHCQLLRPRQKQYTVRNHIEASGISVTAMWAKPKRLGVTTRANAENRPVARPKSADIQRNIAVTR